LDKDTEHDDDLSDCRCSAALTCFFALPVASATDAKQVVKERQTSLGLYLTAREAYEKWKATPDKVKVLDVRTPEELIFIGHAPMAWNVPLAAQTFKWDEAKKQFPMQPLPDFIDRARKIASPQDTLLVMCRSGGRSAMASTCLQTLASRTSTTLRMDSRATRERSGQCVRRPAHDQRLEKLRSAVDVLGRSSANGAVAGSLALLR